MPDIVTSKVFVDGEKGITASKLNQIMSGAVIQPSFVSGKPASSTLDPTDQLLELKGTGSYATITGSQLISSVSAQVDATPQIYSVRLRSFNSLGNCNFEVDQANCNVGVANAPAGGRIGDRWFLGKNGTMGVTTTVQNNNPVSLPGTSYVITGSQAVLQLTTQQTTLGVNDYLQFQQTVEGPAWRELRGDVHSISLLVYSSVAPLTFAVSLRDSPVITKSFVKTVTLSTANVWTLLTLPNLPVFPSGNFSQNPGAVGYTITIALAAGSGLLTPSPGAWASGNYVGVSGMSNWCANPITSTSFYCGFAQHEPGALCTTPMDKPFFQQNLVECQRYYQKTYSYAVKPGFGTYEGAFQFTQPTATAANPTGPYVFRQSMAKLPTVQIYSPTTGAINNIYDAQGAVDRAVSSINNRGENGYSALTLNTFNTTAANYNWHHVADTGW